MLPFLLACTDPASTDTFDDSGATTASETGDGVDSAGDSADTGAVAVPSSEGCGPTHEAFVAALQSDLNASEALGVSAAVMENGEVTCRVALGRKAVEGDEAPDIETLFQIGSTTKMFTALALLQRVDDGQLSLDQSLASAYPDSEFTLNEGWNDAVQLGHLLTHQGGFYDYLDWTASDDDADLVNWHAETFFPSLWLMNDPGKFWNYSNPNFNLAGLIVEHADGDRYYPDLMVEDVFRPLGMNRTYQRKAEAEADGNYAEGYGYIMRGTGGSDYTDVPMRRVPDTASARPAGAGTWTTPEQMLAMAKFLIEGDPSVLADELRGEMVSSRVPLLLTPDGGGYGYGIFVSPGFTLADGYHAATLWDHGGNTLSYSSAFAILPEHGFAVSVLSSGYGTDFSVSVATAISSLVTDLPAAEPEPEYTWEPERLDLHVGTYADTYNLGEMVVSREGDALFIEIPLLDSLGYVVTPELIPVSSDIWYLELDGYYYDLTFIDDGEGQSRWLRNRAFVGTRVSPE